jgi:transposase-like protein
LAELRKLADKSDGFVSIVCPVSEDISKERVKDYGELTAEAFAKKYREAWSRPVEITCNGIKHEIQLNRCTDPFCKWYGLPQTRFSDVKRKPYRYKLSGIVRGSHIFVCNPDPINSLPGATWDCQAVALSNWSIAEEIARLSKNDRVAKLDHTYQFHKDECENNDLTPFNNLDNFYSYGKGKTNGQRWQCKVCKKVTNILPKRRQSFNYHQQRNDILLRLANDLLSKTPIKRTCEALGIGNQTYYSKLEWLYHCCLEFLDRHERKPLATKSFKELWINTDQLVYYLNNVRKKGQIGAKYKDMENRLFQTRILVSGEEYSRYIFRADLAYDWDIRMSEIENDTMQYQDDHLHEFSRKNARLRYSYKPMPPSLFDTQTKAEYEIALKDFEGRKRYVDGLHVNSTYTAIAHLWLIKQMVKSDNWRFISDEDHAIITAILRVFAKEIRHMDAHHFLCKIDSSKKLPAADTESKQARNELKTWALDNGLEGSLWKLAQLKMEEIFQTHQFHNNVLINGKHYRTWARNPVEHPLPYRDQGVRLVDCTTDISNYSPEEIGKMVLNVNNSSTNAFMQQIRRKISFLERPLLTARGNGKSYIYANTNPRYAQYAVTILRTYYNFCKPYKQGDKRLTPAQRLGIAEKQFSLRDIIYFS